MNAIVFHLKSSEKMLHHFLGRSQDGFSSIKQVSAILAVNDIINKSGRVNNSSFHRLTTILYQTLSKREQHCFNIVLFWIMHMTSYLHTQLVTSISQFRESIPILPNPLSILLPTTYIHLVKKGWWWHSRNKKCQYLTEN